MAKRILETCQQERTERERVRQIAAILAEGYLRLMRIRKSSRKEIGQYDEKGPQELPPEQLDSSRHLSDEWGLG